RKKLSDSCIFTAFNQPTSHNFIGKETGGVEKDQKLFIIITQMLEMKKNLLLLFCFFSVTIFSQEYHFDYIIKERSVMLKPKLQEWMSTSFYDSANEVKLYLSVDQNNKTIATIYQRDKNVKHIFNVTKSADNLLFN